MKRVGIIGLGNMGIGMAKNILASGFGVVGYDLRDERLDALEALGGTTARSPREVGQHTDAVFVMVLSGKQVYQVVTGEDGLLQSMKPGSTIIVSATIEPREVREVAEAVFAKGVSLIDTAKALDCSLVRVMSFRKEMILFGSHGADVWNVSKGAWEKYLKLMELPVRIAEDAGVTLVVETGNNAMITSAILARELIDALGSSRLKVLWDPCNSLYCAEKTYPDGYEAIRGDYLGHIHVKDAEMNIPKATVVCKALNTGKMAPYLADLAGALKADKYDGVISLGSVYCPEGGSFEDGFRASVGALKQHFA